MAVEVKHPEKEQTFEVQIAHFISSVAKPVGYTAIAVLVLAAGYVGFHYYQAHLESASQEELFTLQKGVEDKVKKVETDAQEKTTAEEAATTDKKADKKSTKKDAKAAAVKPPAKIEVEHTPQALAANFSDDFKHYDDFIHAHANKKASYMAAIQAARLASDYKDYDRAEKVLKEVVNAPDRADIFSGLLRAQLSTVLIEQNKCNEAEGQLTQITENKSQAYFHSAALLRLGACYIETKEWDKGMNALTRVEKEFANTQTANDAKQLKRLLILKRGSPGAKS